MNLLQINLSANWGSTGKIAEGINLLAQKNGFKTYIAWGNKALESSSELIRIGNKFEYYKHEFESRYFDGQGCGSRLSTLSFLRKIKAIHPDIVHLHNLHGSYVNYRMLFHFLKSNNIPVVWTLHDCWPFTGHCVHFSFCGCEKWKTGCYSCPQHKNYPMSRYFDFSKRNYRRKKNILSSLNNFTLVSVSNWLDGLVSQSFLKDKTHFTIHNGIDTDIFTPSSNPESTRNKIGIRQNELMLLGVAQFWDKRKGLSDFIELSKYLSPYQRIVLVGLNSEQMSSLPSNIIGLKRTESIQQLAEYYTSADLFLNLTYEDNYPTTNLESISCGTPCLTYRTGGSPESVTPETGFVVPQGDINAVLQCIETVQKNGKESYSPACRNHALAHFRQEDRFLDYINLYKQILNI